MTKLMEDAIGALRHAPPDQQETLSHVVLQLAGKEQPPASLYVPDPVEAAELDESAAAARRGEFASDEEVRAI